MRSTISQLAILALLTSAILIPRTVDNIQQWAITQWIQVETPKSASNDFEAVGTIESSFYSAAKKQGLPPNVTKKFITLFEGRIRFQREVQSGDTFRVRYSPDDTILTASYSTRGKMLAAVLLPANDNRDRYFDESGQPLEKHFLRYPLSFSRVSSKFTHKRFHPVLKTYLPHNGVDFAAPYGTPVKTIGSGKVVFAGYTKGGGYTVKIRHDSSYTSAYLHLSKISSGIRKGSFIARGQQIGLVGQSGHATGPHLHFSLAKDGRYVDPLKAELPVVQTRVAPRSIDEFRKTLATLEA